MASAKLITPYPLPDVQLVLTMQEAQLVKRLVGNLAGNANGPRGIGARVFLALDKAGVPSISMELDATRVPDEWPD